MTPEHVELRFAPDTDADTGTFRGTASAYGVLDQHGTEFAPGAFAASIAERRADGGRFPLLLSKRYLKVVVTKNSGTSVAASAVVVRGHPHVAPVAA